MFACRQPVYAAGKFGQMFLMAREVRGYMEGGSREGRKLVRGGEGRKEGQIGGMCS